MTAIAARQLAGAGETVRSFAVDFVGQTENFVPDDLRATPDTPYVHDVAAMSRTNHQDIVLDADQLADPDVRARVIRARDLPLGLGDMDASLLLLFQAIRGHSTVALSGESADEVFGGYKQFFDPAARAEADFPWRVAGSFHDRDTHAILHPELIERMRLDDYVRDGYRTAVGAVERLDGEPALESRMREICNLHLTRFVRQLLDRKDRMSMAVGLEVRVPFCDHRLVDYVYNTPWAMKTYDDREKSLLRGASADVLPRSVVERVKSPYPTTQDPRYVANLKRTARDYLAEPFHPVFDLVSRDWLANAVQDGAMREGGPATGPAARNGIERALNLAVWLDIYRPALKLSSG
jgi:asparagine synthase (glutamine-hydrolysing)